MRLQRKIKRAASYIKWTVWYWFRSKILRRPIAEKEVLENIQELRNIITVKLVRSSE